MYAVTTALTLALLLSACGGGEDDTPAAAGDPTCTTVAMTEAPKPGAAYVYPPPVYLSIRCTDGERVTTTPVVCTGSDACR